MICDIISQCEYGGDSFREGSIVWRQAIDESAEIDGNKISFKELVKCRDGSFGVAYKVKPAGKFRSSGFISKVEMRSDKMKKSPEGAEDSGMSLAAGRDGVPVGVLIQSFIAEDATKISHVEIPIVLRGLEESHCFGSSKGLYQYKEGGAQALIAEYDRWIIASETDRRAVLWQPTGGRVLEMYKTNRGMMVQTGTVYHRNPEGWGPSYVYGKIYDPRITKVVANFTDGTASSQEDFQNRVFSIPYEESDDEGEADMTELEMDGVAWVGAYDKNGNEVCRYKECSGMYYDGWDVSIEN